MTDRLRRDLEALGLAEFYDLLAANDIEPEMLRDLTDANLRELGLTLGKRNRFFNAMRGSQPHATEAVNSGAQNKPTAERRQLTTLFCDLVDSTRLATLLDPEDLRDVIQIYQDACAQVVRSHHGHVAYTQGDGLMAYFGFPLASEDDAARALRCGLELCERVRALVTAAPEPLMVRVGVATGIVVIGESSDPTVSGAIVVGETPNLGARLQQVANPGEVVASDATRRLCGALFDYESRGVVEFKGFATPLPVHRVLREGTGRSRFEAHAHGGLGAIVGRDGELSQLLGLWDCVRAGVGRIAIISGEAGIGKSRLARAFIDQLPREGQQVLQWQCASHLSNRPLHPVVREVEFTAGLVRSMDPSSRRASLVHHLDQTCGLDQTDTGWIADLLGISDGNRPDLDAQTRARHLIEALLRRIDGLSKNVPHLILLEDAHWADPATIDLLSALSSRITAKRVLLLVTHRPSFVAPWDVDGKGSMIVLDKINSAACAKLVGIVTRDRALPETLARAILEKAGGIPLFIEELTKTVLDSLADKVTTSDHGQITIPATLADSLMARLDRLDGAKELAQLGSVIGREFTADMLRVIAPDHADIDGGLQQLFASGLAFARHGDGEGMIVFHHALIQDTAYEALLRKRRQEIHALIAKAMLDGHAAFAGAEPEVIARHCSKAQMDEPAMLHYLEAGLHALDRAANQPAMTYLNAALNHLARVPNKEAHKETELRIHMALAPAIMSIEGWASPAVSQTCTRARSLALEMNDPVSLFGSTWGLWTNYFLRGEMDDAIDTARAVDAMATASGQQALLIAADHAVGFSHYFRGELDEALVRVTNGVARFDAETENYIVHMFQFSSTTALHAFAAATFWMKGKTAQAERSLEMSLSLPEHLSHAPSLAFALAFAQYNLMYMGDWQRVRETSVRLRTLSDREGFQMWVPQSEVFLGLCDAAAGRLDTGLARATKGFEDYAGTGTGLTLSQVLPSLGEFLIEAGRADEAIHRLDAMIAAATHRRETAYISELYRVRALAKAAAGDDHDAQIDADTAIKIAHQQGANLLLKRAQKTVADLGVAALNSVPQE